MRNHKSNHKKNNSGDVPIQKNTFFVRNHKIIPDFFVPLPKNTFFMRNHKKKNPENAIL